MFFHNLTSAPDCFSGIVLPEVISISLLFFFKLILICITARPLSEDFPILQQEYNSIELRLNFNKILNGNSSWRLHMYLHVSVYFYCNSLGNFGGELVNLNITHNYASLRLSI